MKKLTSAVLLTAPLAFACTSSTESQDFEGSKTSSIEETTPRDELESEAGTQDPLTVVRVLAPDVPPEEVKIATLAVTSVDFVGKTIQGTARVDEVLSDRGFYLGQKPHRVFAVIREDVPSHEMIDIDEGDILDFEGLLLSRGARDDLTGELEMETEATLRSVPAFVALYHRDVKIREKKKMTSAR